VFPFFFFCSCFNAPPVNIYLLSYCTFFLFSFPPFTCFHVPLFLFAYLPFLHRLPLCHSFVLFHCFGFRPLFPFLSLSPAPCFLHPQPGLPQPLSSSVNVVYSLSPSLLLVDFLYIKHYPLPFFCLLWLVPTSSFFNCPISPHVFFRPMRPFFLPPFLLLLRCVAAFFPRSKIPPPFILFPVQVGSFSP